MFGGHLAAADADANTGTCAQVFGSETVFKLFTDLFKVLVSLVATDGFESTNRPLTHIDFPDTTGNIRPLSHYRLFTY
ncbi:hypothetical protein [Methylomusa anaerophila]|uniref:hypothetical protein n=1 Tax=Methylomusa anaerophila TaxID=1930071 RepID=UPI001E584836|nr:hypothetical protein [Methylomusa anaerophila]